VIPSFVNSIEEVKQQLDKARLDGIRLRKVIEVLERSLRDHSIPIPSVKDIVEEVPEGFSDIFSPMVTPSASPMFGRKLSTSSSTTSLSTPPPASSSTTNPGVMAEDTLTVILKLRNKIDGYQVAAL
jgi:hypothetical protein